VVVLGLTDLYYSISGRRVGQQPPRWPVAGDGAPRYEVCGEVVAFQRFLERAAEIHLWAPDWPWVRHPAGEKLSRRPVHAHACGVASPTEGSAEVAAVEIQDSQTAKEAFGSDSVADSVCGTIRQYKVKDHRPGSAWAKYFSALLRWSSPTLLSMMLYSFNSL
jgi:hypothetical protein